ncbi:protein PIN-LIKES 3-like isoform X1 [Rhodamnia argentea]|uniref:Protein PIN-LIKES 3-like isoform X1 n=1 Tax=Rhodamnia argentea TaxID=178133 RepID=A0ABM3GW74_9MYRT|nr:protein PIN-LIKES 3-like isoform X1 [Rhodamnia argentea]XP_048128581.1 protein PIN-LIKES 3-like isoform X1 [Rhodamnia argentea]
MALLDLFVVALMPVLKVLLITALGSLLAIAQVDILGEEARKHLNNIVFFVFNPALVFSYLAKSITYESMASLWFMPCNVLLTFILGSALGWMLIRFSRAPDHLQGLVLGCCAAGNLGNMPLIIIPAVCREKGSPFGDPESCNTHGMAYASLSMAIGAIYMSSYVYNIMRLFSSRNCQGSEPDVSMPCIHSAGENRNLSKIQRSELLPLQQFSSVEDHVDVDVSTFERTRKVHVPAKVKTFLRMVQTNINPRTLFAPSTIGAIGGFIIGTTPPLRKAIIGDSAPLHVVQDSASLLGDAAIPTVTLLLGANLLRGLKGSSIHLPVVIGILAVRYIALPLLGMVIVRGAVYLGLVQSDPLYQFVLLLQFALPPAMNIGTMTQLFRAGEAECSVILLWTYVLAAVSLTLWSAFFMSLVS